MCMYSVYVDLQYTCTLFVHVCACVYMYVGVKQLHLFAYEDGVESINI